MQPLSLDSGGGVCYNVGKPPRGPPIRSQWANGVAGADAADDLGQAPKLVFKKAEIKIEGCLNDDKYPFCVPRQYTGRISESVGISGFLSCDCRFDTRLTHDSE